MNFVYTVEQDGRKQTFEGFRRAFHGTDAHPRTVALVFLEGYTELWRLDKDNPRALEELKRYYRSEGYPDVRIGIYHRPDAPHPVAL